MPKKSQQKLFIVKRAAKLTYNKSQNYPQKYSRNKRANKSPKIIKKNPKRTHEAVFQTVTRKVVANQVDAIGTFVIYWYFCYFGNFSETLVLLKYFCGSTHVCVLG